MENVKDGRAGAKGYQRICDWYCRPRDTDPIQSCGPYVKGTGSVSRLDRSHGYPNPGIGGSSLSRKGNWHTITQPNWLVGSTA